mgnify:FL=1
MIYKTRNYAFFKGAYPFSDTRRFLFKKEIMLIKRLKSKLLAMEQNESSYKTMYEGFMSVVTPDNVPPTEQYDPTYFHGEVGYTFERTHKLALDKPTVIIAIPAEQLGIKDSPINRTAAADFCLRAFKPFVDALNEELYNRSRPDTESGRYYLYSPGGEVLPRNSSYFALCRCKDYINGGGSTVYIKTPDELKPPRLCLCVRMQVQLPRKRLRKTMQMLCRDLPDAACFDISALERALSLAEKQAAIRAWLKSSEYCSFIANGSVLPRSKSTDLPMEGAVPFKSVPEDETEICGVRGMAIKRGVTVLTGGGYSGKSTLLDAIAAGIYDHREGDGRELCITDDSAVTISAEDGRSVKRVNISPFIKWLPGGDTCDFSCDRASGSTSQAANIMEAVRSGSRLLLIDEDRSATNFMIRDKMMKRLIEREPITPFTDRVRELYMSRGVSTILVIGGSGEYLCVADRVYMMDEFVISDVTRRAAQIFADYGEPQSPPAPVNWEYQRTLCAEGFTPYPEGSGAERLEASETGFIFIGDERLDTRMLHDIITDAQRNALAFMLRKLENEVNTPTVDLDAAVEKLYAELETEGLDAIHSSFFTTMERFLNLPRKIELYAAINRMRGIKFI